MFKYNNNPKSGTKLQLLSYPESTNFDEARDEVAAEVEGHEALQASDTCAADEDGGGDGGGGGGVGGVGGEGSDLLVVQFDDGGVHADGGEQALHDVAHAAGGTAEDDDWVLGDEALDPHLGWFSDVDGQRGGGGGSELQADAALR